MRVLLLTACVAVCALAAPTEDNSTEDPFITLIKGMESLAFFQNLTMDNKVLTFEMLTAAETRNLGGFFDKLGYVQLLKYIDMLPEDTLTHQFVEYAVTHLIAEGASSLPVLP